MQNNYGDIQYGEIAPGLAESLKMTSAKVTADEISWCRGEYKDHQDEQEAVEYLESLDYRYDYSHRAWRYNDSPH